MRICIACIPTPHTTPHHTTPHHTTRKRFGRSMDDRCVREIFEIRVIPVRPSTVQNPEIKVRRLASTMVFSTITCSRKCISMLPFGDLCLFTTWISKFQKWFQKSHETHRNPRKPRHPYHAFCRKSQR
jgi:hypothetical protein